MTETEVTMMTELLRKNRFKLAWSLEEMSKLEPNMAFHKLNIDPNAKEIIQKKRAFTLERQKAIAKEVEKLKVAS